MASSSSSSLIRIPPPPPPQKVCVVCRRRAKGYLEYWIYIVDLISAAGDYFSSRDPTFRVRDGCFSTPCFCVLGSTLYVFQGYKYDKDAHKFITRGKTVYTYPLPSSDTANLRLTRSMMFVAKAPLKDVKFNPTAVPTPDGKQILVVPTGFHQLKDSSISCVELYDPLCQTSTLIRAPPLERPLRTVRSVKFIGPQTVLLRTFNAGPDHPGCLTLDGLLQGEPKWVDEREWSRNVDMMQIRNPYLMRHGWCFTALRAYDFRNGLLLHGGGGGGGFEYPSASSGDDLSSSIINYNITPLLPDFDSFCTLRVGCTLRPFVMLDVYKFDNYKEGADEVSAAKEPMSKRRRKHSILGPPGVEIVRSIRFYDAQQLLEESDSFSATLSFFSIPAS